MKAKSAVSLTKEQFYSDYINTISKFLKNHKYINKKYVSKFDSTPDESWLGIDIYHHQDVQIAIRENSDTNMTYIYIWTGSRTGGMICRRSALNCISIAEPNSLEQLLKIIQNYEQN